MRCCVLQPNWRILLEVSNLNNARVSFIAEVDDSFLKIEMCGGCKRLYYEGLPERCGNVTYEDRVCGRVAREAIEPVTHCAYKSIKVGITQLISNIDNFFEL